MSITSTLGTRFVPSRRSRMRAVYRTGRRAFETWRTRRTNLRELRSLNDHTLKDIGMHRSELTSIATHHGGDVTRRRRGPRRSFRLANPF